MASVATAAAADIPRNAASKPSTGKSVEMSDNITSKASTPSNTRTKSISAVNPSGKATTTPIASNPRPRSNSTFKSNSPGSRYRNKSNTFSGGGRPKTELEASNDFLPLDTTTSVSSYSHELSEGPEYLKTNVVPKVLEAIHELMFLIKFGTLVPDPVQFIALKLKPDLAKAHKPAAKQASIFRSTSFANPKETVIEEASVLGENLHGSMHELNDELESDAGADSGLTEKEIKIKQLFNGEFY